MKIIEIVITFVYNRFILLERIGEKMLTISTKGRYALRVMVDLAERQSRGYIPLKEIAERQEISEKYLEIIIKSLVKEKFLAGLRGKGGGYRLTKPVEQYTVGSILRITETSLAPVACLEPGAERCERADGCKTLEMWTGFYSLVNDYFEGITIADLASKESGCDNYVI